MTRKEATMLDGGEEQIEPVTMKNSLVQGGARIKNVFEKSSLSQVSCKVSEFDT
jgi:hypothetical protein